MKNIRLIARLDIKGENLIKGIQFEGLRVLGDPNEFATKYYYEGIDEFIYMDSVATLYGRNHLIDLIKIAAKNIFVPITVGGGIRTIQDVENILMNGADKISINSAAIENPKIISEIANQFGSQACVVSVEAKKVSDNKWEAYTKNGRERSNKDVIDWLRKAQDMGAGEFLLTSVDNEGTRSGFDLGLLESVVRSIDIPIIISGGMGKINHAFEAISLGADAIAMASILHYKKVNLSDIRSKLRLQNINLREV